MTTYESRDPGALSRLLEELAEVPRPDVPSAYATGLRPGTEVGRFIIEREIGRGGFGVVYAALDPELGRTVALKLLKPGSSPARKGGGVAAAGGRGGGAAGSRQHRHALRLRPGARAVPTWSSSCCAARPWRAG